MKEKVYNVNIPVGRNWRIVSNNNNYIIQHFTKEKEWTNMKYYTSLKYTIMELLNMKIKFKENISSFKDMEFYMETIANECLTVFQNLTKEVFNVEEK